MKRAVERRITVGRTIDTPKGEGRVVRIDRRTEWVFQQPRRFTDVTVELKDGTRHVFALSDLARHLRQREEPR